MRQIVAVDSEATNGKVEKLENNDKHINDVVVSFVLVTLGMMYCSIRRITFR